jgi:hypothetical protein
MSSFDTGGPAFPQSSEWQNDMEAHNNNPENYGMPSPYGNGMTLRQYAAIHLKVPNSGDEWLDEMIAASVRNDLAAKAMPSFLVADGTTGFEYRARESYEMADEMVKAQKGDTP